MMNFGGTIRLNRTGWIILFFIVILLTFLHFRRPKVIVENETQEKMVDLKDLLIGAIEASHLGGNKVIAGSKGELDIKIKGKTLEGVNDPVTSADFASHCEMLNSLSKAFPNINIRSEEDQMSVDACPAPTVVTPTALKDFPSIESLPQEYVHPKEVTIWIDPLDATKEYTEKLYKFVTTMVCVAVKGVPIIGVIHHPFSKTTSWGWLTKLNSPDLHSQKEPTPKAKENPTVIVSISHKGKVEDLIKKTFGPDTHIESAAGAGYKVLEVSHGHADIYLHNTRIKKWDTCAGNAIISAVGGRMTDLHNITIDYSSDSDPVIKDGLLVTLSNHNHYYQMISKVI